MLVACRKQPKLVSVGGMYSDRKRILLLWNRQINFLSTAVYNVYSLLIITRGTGPDPSPPPPPHKKKEKRTEKNDLEFLPLSWNVISNALASFFFLKGWICPHSQRGDCLPCIPNRRRKEKSKEKKWKKVSGKNKNCNSLSSQTSLFVGDYEFKYCLDILFTTVVAIGNGDHYMSSFNADTIRKTFILTSSY